MAPPCILIADDNAHSRELLRTVLQEDGYTVLECENGEDALLTTRQHRPDLLLLDLRMPRMTGLEVVAALRLIPALAKIPVIAFTASAMQGDRERILAAGFDEYLPKPVHVTEMRRVIAAHLSATGKQIPARSQALLQASSPPDTRAEADPPDKATTDKPELP